MGEEGGSHDNTGEGGKSVLQFLRNMKDLKSDIPSPKFTILSV